MGAKEITRAQLLDAATRLFLERGLLAVPLEGVAAVAGCTRRTLYRHFATKEDLALAVVTGLLGRWNDEQLALHSRLTGTGAEKLRGFLTGLVGGLEGHKATLRLMGEFDFLFQDTSPYRPAPGPAAEFQAVAPVTEGLVTDLLAESVADGSLELPVPVAVLVPTITTALWGLAQRVALRDHRIREEFGVAGVDLVRTQVELIVRALEARPGGNP